MPHLILSFFVSPWTVLSLEYFCSHAVVHWHSPSFSHTGRERLSSILGVSAEEASRFQDSFLQTYREVPAFIQHIIQHCHEHGVCDKWRVETRQHSSWHSLIKLTVFRAAVRTHFYWYYTNHGFYTTVWTSHKVTHTHSFTSLTASHSYVCCCHLYSIYVLLSVA